MTYEPEPPIMNHLKQIVQRIRLYNWTFLYLLVLLVLVFELYAQARFLRTTPLVLLLILDGKRISADICHMIEFEFAPLHPV